MNQEEIIINHMPLVKHIASKYYTSKIGMEYEDLVSLGVIGLIDASKKFDSNKGAKFSTYASMKIGCFIIDEIRKQSPVSRLWISKINDYNDAVKDLQNKLLREPTIDEISNYMNLSKKDIKDTIFKIGHLNTTSLDKVIFNEENEVSLMDSLMEKESLSPSNIVESEEEVGFLAKAIDMLKERDRLVLSLYYYEELTLKEIGVVLGVSESRVSQIHSKAILNLRTIMKDLKYID